MSRIPCTVLTVLLLVAPGNTLAEDSGGIFTMAPAADTSKACYDLCERSYAEVFDDATKVKLRVCEAEMKCITRLLFAPEHGNVAHIRPDEQIFNIDQLLQNLIDGQKLRVDG